MGTDAALLYNPFDPEFRADPYRFYDRLRVEQPAHRSPAGLVVLTRYDDVVQTLRNPAMSRDVETTATPRTDPVSVRRRERAQAGTKTILNLDPPDHTRLRRLVSKAFTPRAVERLRGRMEQLVDDVLDRAEERGRMELVDELAFPIPFQVISDLLALPDERADDIREWSQLLTASLEPTVSLEMFDAADEAALALRAHLAEIIADRRNDLGDDVLSALIVAEEDGERLSAEELLSFVILLYVAGHETTVNLIGNGVLALLGNRSELDRWRDDPGLDATAVDELLRYDGPVQHTVRVATGPMSFHGVDVDAGDALLCVLGAANRDPAVFDQPGELRLDRANAAQHLAFASGIHYCLGASLAKLEAGVAISQLIRRFDRLELLEEPEFRDRLTIRGVERMELDVSRSG
ncbi:MAG: cytochrome P450 [Acidimicrobiales bacterium]